MSESIMDYIKSQELEFVISQDLLGKLEYLLFVRNEMEKELTEVDSMIEDLMVEIRECGIDV